MVTSPMTSIDMGQTRDPNALRAKYLENSWSCYLTTRKPS